MKKRILIISLTCSLAALVLLGVFSAFIYHSSLVKNTVSHLEVYMLSYAQNKPKFVNLDDAAAKALSVEVGNCRVTIIATDGTVLGDSAVGSATLGSHADRAEVIGANSLGKYSDVRSSDTLNKSLIYFCQKFEDSGNAQYQTVLIRIAETGSSVLGTLGRVLPLIIVFVILDSIACVLLSNFAVRQIIKPVEEFSLVAREDKKLPLTAPYKELDSLAVILTQLKRDQQWQLAEIKNEKMRERIILDNMESGIVILREVDEILLINKAAATVLDYTEGGVAYKLISDKQLTRAVEGKTGGLFYRTYKDRQYAVRMSTVEEMNALVMLITDVTNIKMAENSKNEFIANVTHEMNTPLTAISGFAELIASGKLTKEQTLKNSAIIVEQSARLSALIKSILSYSEIEHEKTVKQEFDLFAMVSSSVKDYSAAALNAGLTINAEGGSQTINASSKQVKEIIDNLISNAIKYNRKGGGVRVAVGESLGRVVLTVEDTGIGIAEHLQTKVFDRFFTADISHSGGGFGLGLAIVKKIVATNNWQLSLSSKEGEGTKVSIIF